MFLKAPIDRPQTSLRPLEKAINEGRLVKRGPLRATLGAPLATDPLSVATQTIYFNTDLIKCTIGLLNLINHSRNLTAYHQRVRKVALCLMDGYFR